MRRLFFEMQANKRVLPSTNAFNKYKCNIHVRKCVDDLIEIVMIFSTSDPKHHSR